MVRQHHVLVAVVVQVADGNAGAVGFEVIDRVAGDGGGVVKGGGDEAVSARLGGRVQRCGRYSDWNLACSARLGVADAVDDKTVNASTAREPKVARSLRFMKLGMANEW